MKWKSKEQPIYIWENDIWFNERNSKDYIPNIEKKCWESENEEPVLFTKKTRICKDDAGKIH